MPHLLHEVVDLGCFQKGFGRDFEEIYKGNKQRHFISLKDRSGCEFSEMLFFDNERGNCTQVGTLGVKCVYCPDGLTAEAWEEGIAMFE